MGERANQEHLSGDQADAGPGERTTQPPTTAVQAMLARGKRSPGDIAAVVRANPLAMREILAFLQATLGNGFVQAVVSLLAPQQAGTAAEPHVAAHTAAAEELKAGGLLGPVRVIAHGLRVRRTPDAAAHDNIIGSLHHGAVVTALAQDGEWVRIDHEGKTAYIHSHYVEPVAKRKPADGGDHAPAPAADAHVAAAPAHAPAVAKAPTPALAKEVADAPAPAPAPEAKHPVPEAKHTAPVAAHAAQTPSPTPAPIHDAKVTAPVAEHTTPTPSPHAVTPTPVSFPTPQPQATAAAVTPDHNVGNALVPAGAKEAKANDVESSRGKKGEFLHNDKAGFRATYSIGGDDVLVFVPAGGIVPPTVNIFMFFHGLAENYAENSVNTIVKDKATGKVVDHGDNAALATKLGESVTAAGAQNIIGICPTRSGASWEHDNKGGFTKIVDEVLKNLGGALGAKDPLTRGHISIAGHSAGGRALGGAASDLKDDVTDITLQDAGYGYGGANGAFMNSFLGVRDWLLEGKGGKTLRVIAHTQPLKQGNDGKAVLPDASDTRNVLAQKEGFNKESFEKRIGELTAAGKIKQQLTVTPHDAGHDWKDKTPGAHLESTLTITGSSGVQGTLQVFGIHTDHFGVRNETMDALIQNGAGGDPNIFEPGAKHGALAPAAGGGAAHAQLVSPVVNPAAAKAIADHPQAPAPVAKPTAPAAEHQAQAPAPAATPVVAPPDHSDLHTAVTALANPQVNAVAHDVEMLQAQSRELGKNLDDFEETGKGRDELVAGIGSTRAKIKGLASAGLDPTKLADIQGRFYRALQDLSPYYSQKRNVDILENNVAIGKGQITRTCNVTSLSMSLESIGKSANDYTGDHQQILGIAQVFQGALRGSAELALAGTGANWEAMVGLRMPDFMELVAIAHCLKGAKPTAAAVTKAAQTAFGRILDITFLRALAEEFGATAEVKFFRFDAGDESEGSKESGTLHGFGAKKEQRHHIDKVIDARNLAEASGSKADRTKYEKLVKDNQAALDGKGIETKLSVDAYKKAVIAHLGAELATGAAIETHVDNHFVRLQTLEDTHVVIDDPGSFKRSNKKVLWEEARAQGMFDKRIVIR